MEDNILNDMDIIWKIIVDFERENVCLVHIEKTNAFEDNIAHIMRYVVVF